MKNMILLARRFARPKLPARESLPVTDRIYGVVDPRATARARSRGENKLYQIIPRRSILNTLNEFEGFDPIVWVFEKQISLAVENLVLDDETPNLVIGLAATPRLDRGGLEDQCRFQLLATWVPRLRIRILQCSNESSGGLPKGTRCLFQRNRRLERQFVVRIGRVPQLWKRRCSWPSTIAGNM